MNQPARAVRAKPVYVRPLGNGDKTALETFASANKQHMASDHDGDMVFLTRPQWDIDRVERDCPEVRLTATKEMMV